MGFGSVMPGGSKDFLFGGMAAAKAGKGLANAQQWQAEQEAKRKEMIGRNDTKFGFGSTTDALRNRQRINNAADAQGQNVFNQGMQSASAGFGSADSAIRQNEAASGMATSSFAQQQRQNALNRYYNSVGQAAAMQDSAINDYESQLAATRQADQDVINNRQITDLRQQYIDKAQLQASRDGAFGRAIQNNMSDVSAGFGGG